ncbi:serine hydrolase [Bradyrhizobium sp. AUGA SZCCT0177]|uniref:serine hydrolase domain-containing protein n=1 Tax=Bradyrhizobium sp. AUGA SZCCT0177 TaxID=2807665 RepID=UPI001BA53ED7|nr:serine hydrolase [Bradyrhizobium sp. AUGA SZCCT0177]MBR1287018.1 serine hydrolase [Bradyrhizobium sp. AUGA SZCCT0177]
MKLYSCDGRAPTAGGKIVNVSRFNRRQVLAGAGGILMGPLAGPVSAAAAAWQSISLREAGFDDDLPARLDKAIADKRIWNLHGVVVVRRGRLVFERYFEGEDTARGNRPVGVVSFKPDTLHDLRSVSKSIVGLLYGIALAAGKVPAPEDRLMQSFPEYADLAADPARSRWTLHHVLSMTMGTDWNESMPYTNPANSETAMDMAPDRYRYILDRPIVTEPGQRWVYNGGATALLGRLIAKGTGKSLHAYAREALFDPLGIGPTDWHADNRGELIAASGIRMTPRDLARIGELTLRGGVWEGRSVVPAEWIARSTSPVVPIEEERKYGYQWYNLDFTMETPTMPRSNQHLWNAAGNGGQRLTVFPGLDLVVASTAGNYNTKDANLPPRRIITDVVMPSLL